MSRTYEITSASLVLLGFLNQMRNGSWNTSDELPIDLEEWTQTAQALYQEYAEGYEMQGKKGAIQAVEIALRALRKNDEGLDFLLSEAIPTSENDEKKVEKAISAMRTMPPLPSDVALFEEDILHRIPQAREWLDAYIEWSTTYSPRAPYIFHEIIGLWLLSAVAMRRIYIPLDTGMYTNLYVMLAADSSKFAKTFTIRKAKALLENIGLDWMLIPGRMTPEVFYRISAGHIPDDFETMTEEEIAMLKRRLAFAGKQPVEIPEFGNMMASLMQAQSPMKMWETIMLSWDDCPKYDSNATIGRGKDGVDHPYLAALVSLTVSNIRDLPKSANPYERGFMARFAIATPQDDEWNLKHSPEGRIVFPSQVTQPLLSFHRSLGVPQVGDIQEILNRKGVRTGYRFERAPWETYENECTFASGVIARYNAYGDALGMIAYTKGLIPEQLGPSYNRLQEKSMRIAALLSWMSDGGGRIEMHHYAAAQAITERLRQSIHNFHNQVSGSSVSHGVDLEDKIKTFVEIGQKNNAPMRAYDISSRIRAKAKDVNEAIRNMCATGTLVEWKIPGGKNGKQKIFVYTLAKAPAPKGAIIDEDEEGQGKND